MNGALEKMLGNMLGVKPEELHGMVTNTIGLLTNLTDTLVRIENKVDYLAQHLGIETATPENPPLITGNENDNGN